MNLTATVITLNEENQIANCLESVKKIADEIVVVDSGSVDATCEIAKGFGAKIYLRNFDNYANQKNFAAEKAFGEWILSLDADEVISPELGEEIVKATNDKSLKFDAYSIPRKNIIFGKSIKYTRWQPELDRHIWLWRRGRGKWVGMVHEEVVVDGMVGKLKNAKIHYQYETISEFMEMMDKYSELEAEKRVKTGVKFSYFRFLFGPLYNFLVRFIYRLGFLDGWRGFFLSFLMAIYYLELWIKIWERENAQ